MDYFLDLEAGDPMPRNWFLLKSSWEPVSLSLLYVMVCKYIGPWYMKNKRPFELRNAMILYNGTLVGLYAVFLSIALRMLTYCTWDVLCKGTILQENTLEYKLVNIGYLLYLLKYVEFLDTIFFVLRKKNRLLTTLHLTHHAMMPIVGFILFRTERSGAQAVPAIINSVVHIVMYSYYFLAALGPQYAKYLWWKRYLTLMQMTQFVMIMTFAAVILPLSGCRTAKTTIALDIAAAVFFFILFYNFYQHCFVKTKDTKPIGRNAEKEG